ncbi:MAG: biosynthetic-type acetolactate synthase large subunit [Clostridia bacterium]|nr:biosynthetic-type acetolactate synthase large subunit [Clostridia bacterium]
MKLTGAEILVKSLEAEGVDTIFGYPGGGVLNIYDALYDCNLNHVLTRHEQGAAHAADGYARATGKPGVCLATSGPGATNLVTGLANAYMDSIPLVALTGQVATNFIGKDSFQEADITGITLPVTKHNYLVKDVKELSRVIKEAFHIATTGRPGPVLIDIPKDISATRTDFEYPETVNLRGYNPYVEAGQEQINLAAQAIAGAQRPVIYAGGGIIASHASAELKQLAELILAPVTTTLMAMGCFPENHPLSLGMLGMHGTAYANYAVSDCDLLIAVGARFDDRVTGNVATFAPDAKIIHIDIDPAEMGKNVRVDIRVLGDVKNSLARLVERVSAKMATEWQDKIARWKKEHPLSYDQKCGGLKPQYVIEQISELTKDREAKICTEVGQHQMWAAQYYTFTQPRSFISSGGLGTMGYGFPSSIGAQVGCPDATVFNIAGDGSIQMNIQELATAVQYELPVNVAIMNNGFLGMVRQWQEMFYKRRYCNVEITAPDFVKLAEAYGAEGIRVTEAAQVKPALEQAMASSKPVFLDFIVEKEENVFPMVPPGGSLNKMIGG